MSVCSSSDASILDLRHNQNVKIDQALSQWNAMPCYDASHQLVYAIS